MSGVGETGELKVRRSMFADESSGDGESGHAGPGEFHDNPDANVGRWWGRGRRTRSPRWNPRALGVRGYEWDDEPPPPRQYCGERTASASPSSDGGGGRRSSCRWTAS